jgi:hypothetical protein
MRRTLLLTLALLAGCDDETTTATTEARPACVADHPWICGLAPPQRPVAGGVAYDLATVTGERFSVVLADERAVVAAPAAPLRVNAGLTTATPREAADRVCHDFRACTPVPVRRDGRITRWDDASGTIRDLGITTVDHGDWTLVLLEPSEERARRVAQAVSYSVDADGFPRLEGEPVREGWARVDVWVGDVLIDVLPGSCDTTPELVPHPPDSPPGGSWCADGYAVAVHFADRPRLERLHATLRIIPG